MSALGSWGSQRDRLIVSVHQLKREIENCSDPNRRQFLKSRKKRLENLLRNSEFDAWGNFIK